MVQVDSNSIVLMVQEEEEVQKEDTGQKEEVEEGNGVLTCGGNKDNMLMGLAKQVEVIGSGRILG